MLSLLYFIYRIILMMMQNLPSKKVFIVVAISAGFLIFSIIYSNFSDTSKNKEFAEPFLKNIAQVESLFPDSDGDGLEDWEENLFKTNAFDNDSDGDGLSDGEELITYRSIYYTEPSDSIFNNLNSVGNLIGDQTSIGSLTLKPTFYPDKFSIKDITMTETNDVTISLYVYEILNTMNDYVDILEKEPLAIIKHWLETFDQKDIKELEKISVSDKELAELLLQIEVPNELVGVHLAIINNLYKGALSLDNIEITVLDPTAGFFTAANYANYRSKRTEAIFTLTQYFNFYTEDLG